MLGEKLCRLRILKHGFYVLLRMCKQKEMREVTTNPKPNTAVSQVRQMSHTHHPFWESLSQANQRQKAV